MSSEDQEAQYIQTIKRLQEELAGLVRLIRVYQDENLDLKAKLDQAKQEAKYHIYSSMIGKIVNNPKILGDIIDRLQNDENVEQKEGEK